MEAFRRSDFGRIPLAVVLRERFHRLRKPTHEKINYGTGLRARL